MSADLQERLSQVLTPEQKRQFRTLMAPPHGNTPVRHTEIVGKGLTLTTEQASSIEQVLNETRKAIDAAANAEVKRRVLAECLEKMVAPLTNEQQAHLLAILRRANQTSPPTSGPSSGPSGD
jgi:Spy/CpxP family protein refolding chaperone